MELSLLWHGHANFQIQTPHCNILIDPFFTHNPLTSLSIDEITPPDLVLVTHLHGDHEGDAIEICKKYGATLGAVVGAAEDLIQRGLPASQVINGIGFNIGGTVTIKDSKITAIEAFHTSEAGVPVGYILTFPDGYTIYHAGDTGIFVNMSTWGSLYNIDLALLPIGGVFTMDARQAALAAKMLGAKAVIPMHYKTFPLLAQNADAFQQELEATAPDCRFISMQPGENRSLPV